MGGGINGLFSLIEKDIVKFDEKTQKIKIEFLDEQFIQLQSIKTNLSESGKKGAAKRWGKVSKWGGDKVAIRSLKGGNSYKDKDKDKDKNNHNLTHTKFLEKSEKPFSENGNFDFPKFAVSMIADPIYLAKLKKEFRWSTIPIIRNEMHAFVKFLRKKHAKGENPWPQTAEQAQADFESWLIKSKKNPQTV